MKRKQPLPFNGPFLESHSTSNEPSSRTLLLAHGTGAGMNHAILLSAARFFVSRKVDVVRFEFPFMKTLQIGQRPVPDADEVLAQCFLDTIDSLPRPRNLFIGGYSLGARIAASVCRRASVPVRGLLAFSYPFHVKGEPSQRSGLKTLLDAGVPSLIVQGERDSFGNAPQVRGYRLNDDVKIHWVADANHALVPRIRSAHSSEQLLYEAFLVAERFVSSNSTGCL